MASKAVRFEVSFAGEKQLSRALVGMLNEIDDFRPTFREMVDVVYEKVEKRQFESDGRKGSSGGWPQLRPSTVEKKARTAPGARILRERGAMAASITKRNHPNAIVQMTRKRLGIGTTVVNERGRPYWRFHQTGTRNMAQRRPYDLTERDRREITAPLGRRLRAAWLAPRARLGFRPV